MKRESKPDWSEVPIELKNALGRLVGAAIVDASVAWGGFGPSATFILQTVEGRKFFCKGTHPGFTKEGRTAFFTELGYYQAVPELSAFGPAFRGAASYEDWHLLVLDFVQRNIEVPPWTDATFRGAIAMLARFHAHPPARARERLPIAEEQPEFMGLYRAENGWKALTDPLQFAGFLALFQDQSASARWLDAHLGEFIALEERTSQMIGPRSWVHHDVRSDNLLFQKAGEPLLIDFPYLAYGPTLMDVAFFLPSVAGEGGPMPSQGLRLYQEIVGHRFDDGDTAIAVATVAGFFAARAGLPELPGLPRLRWVQRLKLIQSLNWLTEVIGIDPPPAWREVEP